MHPNQTNGFPCRCEDCENERRKARELRKSSAVDGDAVEAFDRKRDAVARAAKLANGGNQ